MPRGKAARSGVSGVLYVVRMVQFTDFDVERLDVHSLDERALLPNLNRLVAAAEGVVVVPDRPSILTAHGIEED